jgi:hypothetical protein
LVAAAVFVDVLADGLADVVAGSEQIAIALVVVAHAGHEVTDRQGGVADLELLGVSEQVHERDQAAESVIKRHQLPARSLPNTTTTKAGAFPPDTLPVRAEIGRHLAQRASNVASFARNRQFLPARDP